MTKEIGEVKSFTKALLLNPLKKEEIPKGLETENVRVSVIFTKKPIDGIAKQLIQKEIQRILGKNYLRSYISI